VLDPNTRLSYLRLLLRLGGALLVTAFLAVLLPVDWMASTHQWLGMGELPRAPVVDYLARSVAALYGFHGILLFVIARDPARYRTIVRYLAFMNLALGVMLIAIDLQAGLPLFWTLAEGPSVLLVGVLLHVLNRP
jgi:hypothetical protein